MNFKEALRLNIGDRVYAHSGEILIISGWHQNFENHCINDDLYFNCVDTALNSVQYRYDELCGLELCDEDKMFIEWYSNKCPKNDHIIQYLKSAFMRGFQCGYSHKKRVSCEDQLQK
jgi:hypothetical protein